MIDKKDLDAYMSIKAPDSLKTRIAEEPAKNNSKISSIVRTCYALAAVLLITVTVFAFLPDGKTEIYYNGTSPDDKAVIVKAASNPNARIMLLSVTEDLIPITVKTDKKTEITVSKGNIIVIEDGEEKNMGKSVTLKEDTDVLWSVSLVSGEDGPTMTVGKVSYSISENSKAQWVLSKK